MNYFKMALLCFNKRPVSYVLVIIEMTLLILVQNIAVSTISERYILNETYEKILDEGYIYAYDSNAMTTMIFEDISQAEARERLVEKFTGDYEIIDITAFTSNSIVVYSLSDELYDSLSLPLKSGSYSTGSASAVATSAIGSGEKTIDFSNGSSLTLDVCGILTDYTYVPAAPGYSSDYTTKDLFSSIYGNQLVIITNRSTIEQFEGYEKYFYPSFGFFISFNSDAEANLETLQQYALCVSADDIKANTQAAIENDVKSLLPVIITVLAAVLVGTICISVILWKEREYEKGVLWMCGHTKLGIISSHMFIIVLMEAVSVIISVLFTVIAKAAGNEFLSTVGFTGLNVLFTLLTCIFILALSAAVPLVNIARRSPVEYLRRTL